MRYSKHYCQMSEAKSLFKDFERVENNISLLLSKPNSKRIVKSWVKQYQAVEDVFHLIRDINRITPYSKSDLIPLLDTIFQSGLSGVKSTQNHWVDPTGEVVPLNIHTHHWITPTGEQLIFNEVSKKIQLYYCWPYIFNYRQCSFTNLAFPLDNLLESTKAIIDKLFVLKVSNEMHRMQFGSTPLLEQIKRSENASKGSNHIQNKKYRKAVFDWLDLNWNSTSKSQVTVRSLLVKQKNKLGIFVEESTIKLWVEDYVLQLQVLKLMQSLKLKINK